MRVEISSTRLDITDALKKYTEIKIKSVERMLKKFEVHGEIVAFVELSRTTRHHKQGDVYYAEITMKLPQKTIRIEKTHEDVRGAIDQLKNTLKEDISKLKEINNKKIK